MRQRLRTAAWFGVYLLVTLTPLFVLLIGPTPPGRGFWRELSVALGFAGLSVMGFQFLLTARFQGITKPYGIDIIYHFHRQISILAALLILAHPLILVLAPPVNLSLLNPVGAPRQTLLGMAALLALLAIIVTSLWRERLGLNYEPWRFLHGALAVGALGLGMAHAIAIEYYLSVPWKRFLWLALGVGWIGSLLYVRIIKPLMLLRRPYRVAEVIEERGDSWTLVLEPEEHATLAFLPGQFAWLTVWNSPFQIREHPFSFSSSAMRTDQVSFTVKELGDFTATIGEIPEGKQIYVDGPYGTFSIDRFDAPGYVFLAGGIGITPIMSMLRTMADRNDERPLLLFYGNQRWEQITFREDLDQLAEQLKLQLIHVLEEPPEHWEGEEGFIDADMLERYLPANRQTYHYFICGPDPMMDAVEEALATLEIPFDHYHSERFNLV